jgi:hypothetical protein
MKTKYKKILKYVKVNQLLMGSHMGIFMTISLVRDKVTAINRNMFSIQFCKANLLPLVYLKWQQTFLIIQLDATLERE